MHNSEGIKGRLQYERLAWWLGKKKEVGSGQWAVVFYKVSRHIIMRDLTQK